MNFLAIPTLIMINCFIGVIFHLHQGFPGRFTQDELLLFDKFQLTNERAWDCQQGVLSDEKCNPRDNNASIIVWGDSHSTALASHLWETDQNFSQKTLAGCPSIPNAKRLDLIEFNECSVFNIGVMRHLEERKNPFTLIVSNRWSYYLIEKNLSIRGEIVSTALINEALSQLASSIEPNRLIIIGQVPESRNNPMTVARMKRIWSSNSIETFKDVSLTIDFSGLSNSSNVTFIDPKQLICDASECDMFDDTTNSPWLFDTDHISDRYSQKILSLIEW